MTGQDAVNTAKEFNERLDFNGVVLTKLDGDTRGGAALSIRSVVNKPIKFVGTGEKLEAIDQKADLLQHKRVFEALGSQMAVQSVDDQLSGVGFSETQHNSFIVKVQGATERVLKVVI